MRDQHVEAAINELLPSLTKHLETTLSAHLKVRYPVEDLVHDTYVRAMENLDTLQRTNRTSLAAWLQRISHRLAIDRVRRKQSQQIDGREASVIYSALTASRQLTPSREGSATETMHLMQAAMSDLSDDHRLVLKLRYHDQLTFVQIADQLDCKAGAVRGMHRNALNLLRSKMGGSSLYFFR